MDLATSRNLRRKIYLGHIADAQLTLYELDRAKWDDAGRKRKVRDERGRWHGNVMQKVKTTVIIPRYDGKKKVVVNRYFMQYEWPSITPYGVIAFYKQKLIELESEQR